MDPYSTPKNAFIRDLWAKVGTQLAVSNIITIATDDFVRLGQDGEKFFKGQLSIITNGLVEFFSDAIRDDRVYLANPNDVIREMNFNITYIQGERFRALEPIMPVPPIDLEDDVFTDVMPQSLEPMPATPLMWYPQYPSPMSLDYHSYLYYSPEIVSPGSSHVLYNNKSSPCFQKFYRAEEELIFMPCPMHQISQTSSPLSDLASEDVAVDCITVQRSHAGDSQEEEKEKEEKDEEEEDDEEDEEGEHIARPPNAFMLFRKAQSAQIRQRKKKLGSIKISKIVGRRWSAMSEQDKQPWHDQAADIAQEHKRLHPDYKYQPGKRVVRRRRPQATS